MDVHVYDEIDCALLFDRFYPPVDEGTVLAILNDTFPDAGFRTVLQGPKGNLCLRSADGQIFVLLSQNRKPLPMDGFRQALLSPYQQILCPRIDEAVAEHTSNLWITVTHKPPLGDLINPAFKVTPQPAPLVERKIIICQRLAAHLAAPLGATAVHWCQSNLILTPKQFSAAAGASQFPTPLHIHPQLFSNSENSGGRRSMGFVTLGARHVIGREIVFNECPADLHWMHLMAVMYVWMARNDGYRLIPDGDTFGTSPDEVIRVRHRPPEGDDVPLIELTVEKSLEQGIGPEPPPSPAEPSPANPAAPPSGAPVFGKRRSL
jgi:hypothetical protein